MAARRLVLGMFPDTGAVEDVVDELQDEGFDPKEFSIVMRDKEQGERLAKDTGTNVAGAAVSGATAGGIIGGLAGLLIGIGAIAIPGLGALLIGGPLAAALGLTGAAASTVSGAVTGALAGGLVGGLMGLGVPEEDARYYEDRIREGAILLAVPVSPGREDDVREILEDNGVDQLRTIDFDESHIERHRSRFQVQ